MDRVNTLLQKCLQVEQNFFSLSWRGEHLQDLRMNSATEDSMYKPLAS